MGQIYKITIQKPSGEKFNYIGKSSQTSEIRFKGHLKGHQMVDRYIRKYGLEATVLTTLVYGIETEEELNDLESYYIQKFESYKPWGKNGLNLTLGGDGARKYDISKEELQGYLDAGMTNSEICIKLGNMSSTALKTYMDNFGVNRKTLFEIHEATIRQMVSDGKHLGEISAATGINSCKLCTSLKKNGLQAAKKKRSKLTEEQISEIIRLTKDGKSSFDIEQSMGIHWKAVRRVAIQHGLVSTALSSVSKSATIITKDFIEEVTKLRASGLSMDAVARELKCGTMTVCDIERGKYNHLR